MTAATSRILRQVQSGRMEDFQRTILHVAAKWMAVGCIDQANCVLSPLFEAGHDLSAHRYYLVAFEIPWALTGTRPQHAPISAPSFEHVEQELWDHLFLPRWADSYLQRIKNTELAQLSGEDLRIRAIIMAYDKNRPGHVASPDMLAAASAALDRYFTSAPGDPGTLITRALLAARLSDGSGVRKHLIRWAESYNAFPQALIDNRDSIFNFRDVLMDRTVAQIALSGILAPVWKITPEECEEEAQAIEKAVRERVSSGQQLAYGNLTWQQLLQRLSQAAAEKNKSNNGSFGLVPGMLGYVELEKFVREPATDMAIEAVEKRLGLALPESYRAFLKVTNGLERYGFPGVTIMPVEQIAWLRDIEQDTIDAYSYPELDDLVQKLRKSLLIGSAPRSTDRLLLVPGDDPVAEWECWYFAHWIPGEIRYRTFRYFIESELQQRDTKSNEAD